MIGILGRYACQLRHTGIPSFTASPDSVTIDAWEAATVDRGGWATGSGPVTAVVPVDGVYLVSLGLNVNALHDPGVGDTNAVQAQVAAGFDTLYLSMETPAWVTDDEGGSATQLVSGGKSALMALAAGTPLEVSLAILNADPTLTDMGIHLLTLDLVRVASI